MISYTLFIIFSTLMFTSGIIFWIICLFNQNIQRPGLLLFGCLFWPFTVTFMYIYVYVENMRNKRLDI